MFKEAVTPSIILKFVIKIFLYKLKISFYLNKLRNVNNISIRWLFKHVLLKMFFANKIKSFEKEILKEQFL